MLKEKIGDFVKFLRPSYKNCDWYGCRGHCEVGQYKENQKINNFGVFTLISQKSTLNLLVTANWSCIEAHIIAAVKIRAQVTLLKTESRVSTMKARPWMLLAAAKSFRTCKTTILEISLDGTRLKKIRDNCRHNKKSEWSPLFTFGPTYIHIIKEVLVECRLKSLSSDISGLL